MEELQEAARQHATEGPVRLFGVTILAVFEFLKAGFLLVVCAITFLQPKALPPARGFFRLFLSVALRAQIIAGRHDRSAYLFVAVVFPIYAAIAALFGYGVWRLRRWAWYGLVYSSAITLGNWLVYSVIDRADTVRLLSDPGVQGLVISDILVFAYLMKYQVKETFGYWKSRADA